QGGGSGTHVAGGIGGAGRDGADAGSQGRGHDRPRAARGRGRGARDAVDEELHEGAGLGRSREGQRRQARDVVGVAHARVARRIQVGGGGDGGSRRIEGHRKSGGGDGAHVARRVDDFGGEDHRGAAGDAGEDGDEVIARSGLGSAGRQHAVGEERDRPARLPAHREGGGQDRRQIVGAADTRVARRNEIGHRGRRRRAGVDRHRKGSRRRPLVPGVVGRAGRDQVDSGREGGGDEGPGSGGGDGRPAAYAVDEELDADAGFGAAGEGERGETRDVVGIARAAVAGRI